MDDNVLTKEKLEQLIESVRVATLSPEIFFLPSSIWIKEMENNFDRFYISEKFGLMWLGCRVGVTTLNGGEELIEKWKRLNKLKN